MGSIAALGGCGGDDDDAGGGGDGKGGKGGSSGSGTGGSSTGGKATGGASGSSTGGKATGGASGSATGGTAGTATGGAGGAPGGAGGEGGASGGDRQAVCNDYCELYFDTGCEAFPANLNVYATVAQCEDICFQANWALGEPGDGAGNSVHCRLTHAGLASNASGADIETHCGHASATSTGNCI